jgi:Domain of unknown function (DUF4234)
MSEPARQPSAPIHPPAPPPTAPAGTAAPPATRPAYGSLRLAGESEVKLRNPVLVAVLVFVTLGIYQIVWWYLANRELADHGRAYGRRDLGDDPARSTLALFPGGLIVVPAVWTTVTTFQRIQNAQRLHGQQPINGWLGLVLVLVLSPALVGYMQSGLNSAWVAAAEEPVR